MKKIKLNIYSGVNDYETLISEIHELVTSNSEIEFIIQLLRVESETPENTSIEIEVEYPIIGKVLLNLCDKFSNLNFDKNIDWNNSHILNKVVIIDS